MASKCKSSDVGNLNMPKREAVVLPSHEKSESSQINKERKKMYVPVTEIYSESKSFI